jgi:hypothetical protein
MPHHTGKGILPATGTSDAIDERSQLRANTSKDPRRRTERANRGNAILDTSNLRTVAAKWITTQAMSSGPAGPATWEHNHSFLYQLGDWLLIVVVAAPTPKAMGAPKKLQLERYTQQSLCCRFQTMLVCNLHITISVKQLSENLNTRKTQKTKETDAKQQQRKTTDFNMQTHFYIRSLSQNV